MEINLPLTMKKRILFLYVDIYWFGQRGRLGMLKYPAVIQHSGAK